jgi:cysteinyl-tRNA synthetase
MTIRFFILQAHYRSTLDFSNEALQAAEKGFKRLMEAMDRLDGLKVTDHSGIDAGELSARCYEAMDDDLNTPVMISHLFDGVRMINSVADGKESITVGELEKLKELFSVMVFEVLGLKKSGDADGAGSELTASLIEALLELRRQARERKDFDTSDRIRDRLTELGIAIKDGKDGTEWTLE